LHFSEHHSSSTHVHFCGTRKHTLSHTHTYARKHAHTHKSLAHVHTLVPHTTDTQIRLTLLHYSRKRQRFKRYFPLVGNCTRSRSRTRARALTLSLSLSLCLYLCVCMYIPLSLSHSPNPKPYTTILTLSHTHIPAELFTNILRTCLLLLLYCCFTAEGKPPTDSLARAFERYCSPTGCICVLISDSLLLLYCCFTSDLLLSLSHIPTVLFTDKLHMCINIFYYPADLRLITLLCT
jgi:hypothetical protein